MVADGRLKKGDPIMLPALNQPLKLYEEAVFDAWYKQLLVKLKKVC